MCKLSECPRAFVHGRPTYTPGSRKRTDTRQHGMHCQRNRHPEMQKTMSWSLRYASMREKREFSLRKEKTLVCSQELFLGAAAIFPNQVNKCQVAKRRALQWARARAGQTKSRGSRRETRRHMRVARSGRTRMRTNRGGCNRMLRHAATYPDGCLWHMARLLCLLTSWTDL